jgi:DUF4097 and DUF4098 domain-containing protein YvlB
MGELMATFETPNEISVTVDLPLGAVHLMATRRRDTVVVVNPTDPSTRMDVEAAKATRIDMADNALVIKVPKSGGLGSFIGLTRSGSVDMTIELPEGSQVDITTGFADVRADGSLADANVHSGAGNVRLDEVGNATIATGAGSVNVNRISGKGKITTAGDMHIGSIDGAAEIKNLNGKTWLGEVSGRLQVKSANGDITVGQALSDMAAKTGNGSIQIGEVVTGSSTLETGSGNLEIGIGHGTAAWVDARTRFGRVHNNLEVSDGPGATRQTVEVTARTSFGDITVLRSTIKPEQKGRK